MSALKFFDGSNGGHISCLALLDQPAERFGVSDPGLGEGTGDGHAVNGGGDRWSLHLCVHFFFRFLFLVSLGRCPQVVILDGE